MHTRIVLTADDFQRLIEGGIVEARNSRLPGGSDKIEIVLEDMGFCDMQDRLSDAILNGICDVDLDCYG